MDISFHFLRAYNMATTADIPITAAGIDQSNSSVASLPSDRMTPSQTNHNTETNTTWIISAGKVKQHRLLRAEHRRPQDGPPNTWSHHKSASHVPADNQFM
jgi:hypothetical protein